MYGSGNFRHVQVEALVFKLPKAQYRGLNNYLCYFGGFCVIFNYSIIYPETLF